MGRMTKNNKEEITDGTPIDSMIEKVNSYIDDPKLVSRETLTELRDDLIDLKEVVDDEGMNDMDNEHENNGKGGLAVMISVGKKKKARKEDY